jgi:hypothetical protein
MTCIYVDDMGNHSTKLAELRSYLKSRYKMTDLGTLSHSLGLEYLFHPKGILVTQRSYLAQMLLDAGLQDCYPARTTMMQKLSLLKDMKAPAVDAKQYQQMVGKLNFLCQSRPDITFAVNIVSRTATNLRFPILPQSSIYIDTLKTPWTLGSYFAEGRTIPY